MSADPFFLLVSGPPGAGKTTIARELAPKLGLPLIAKDAIKESLADSFGRIDHDWSKQLGAATWELIWMYLERFAADGASALFESNFYPEFARPRLIDLRTRHPFVPFEVHCIADLEILRRRDAERPRHPIHFPGEYPDHWVTMNGPLELSEHVVRLDTSDSEPFDLDGIVTTIGEVWRGQGNG